MQTKPNTLDIKDSFTDSRDGKIYKTVQIGTQIWMAENLNYNASGSKCYNNKPKNCAEYGRLYSWDTANEVCPFGWHLPSDSEWTALMNFVGSSAGTKLKTTSGWNDNGNGTDEFGFAALPGGYGYSGGSFSDLGYSGLWWSATECIANCAYVRCMYYGYSEVNRFYDDKSNLFSVRCVKD